MGDYTNLTDTQLATRIEACKDLAQQADHIGLTQEVQQGLQAEITRVQTELQQRPN